VMTDAVEAAIEREVLKLGNGRERSAARRRSRRGSRARARRGSSR
jgi:hypothetical protein